MTQLLSPRPGDGSGRVDPRASTHLGQLEVHLKKIDHNFKAIHGLLGRHRSENGTRLCAVIKKDAYGLGAVPIAHRLIQAGCPMLAVYSTQEASQLVQQKIAVPLLLFMPVTTLSQTDPLYRHAVAGKLHLSIHEPGQLEQLNRIGQAFGIQLPVHLYLDTGMSRGGLNAQKYSEALEQLQRCSHVCVVGVYSHLATADSNSSFALWQLKQFKQLTRKHANKLPTDVMHHIGNSCATMRGPGFHLDMVRCGLGLFGYGARDLKDQGIEDLPALEPAVRWVSHIIHVERYPHHTPIGYGGTHRLGRNSVLGVVPVGYGDGYPLQLSNKAQARVMLPGHPPIDCRVLGKVNMDQIVLDLTEAAIQHPNSLLGCNVELISDDPEAPCALPTLAKLAHSHCHEMLCRIAAHVPRKYVS